jgi:hypothetical protein
VTTNRQPFSGDLLMDAVGFSATVVARPHGHVAHGKIAFEQIQFLDTGVFLARIVRPGRHPDHGGCVAACGVIEQNFEENAWKLSRCPGHLPWTRDQYAICRKAHPENLVRAAAVFLQWFP